MIIEFDKKLRVFLITILNDIQRKNPKNLKIVRLSVKQMVKNPYYILNPFKSPIPFKVKMDKIIIWYNL